MRQQTKRLTIATLFGAVTFVAKTFAPSPVDKMLIVVQGFFLAVGALLLRRMGATYVAVVGGTLTVLLRPALAPFTFFFALLYGLLVDGFLLLFKVNIDEGRVNCGRLVAALTISTMMVGLVSYYTTALLIELVPRNLALEVIILVVGTVNGAFAGYLASVAWNKYLKNIEF